MILNVIINHNELPRLWIDVKPRPYTNNGAGLKAVIRCDYYRITPVLMNQRSRNGEAVTPGDGNSGYLKWVPFPFQITDAIPRVVPRIFYKALTKRCIWVAQGLTCQRIVNPCATHMQRFWR